MYYLGFRIDRDSLSIECRNKAQYCGTALGGGKCGIKDYSTHTVDMGEKETPTNECTQYTFTAFAMRKDS